MEPDDKAKSEIHTFLENYEKEFKGLYRELEDTFISRFSGAGLGKADKLFSQISDSIRPLSTLSCTEDKVKELDRVYTEFRIKCEPAIRPRTNIFFIIRVEQRDEQIDAKSYEYCDSLITRLREVHARKESYSILDEIADKIQEMTNKVVAYHNYTINKAYFHYRRIEECGFGKKQNWAENGRMFEREVMNLIDWLFIDELKKIGDLKLKVDGAYEVTNDFNTLQRCGKTFSHLFIECKNKERPNGHDVMQLYAYTLDCMERALFKIPICILISRKNPSTASIASNLRSAVLNRRIADEERLLLVLQVSELKEMLDLKKDGRDPASLFKKQILELGLSEIKKRRRAPK